MSSHNHCLRPSRTNGALLLHHLSAMHRAEVKPLLERLRTEDIGTVAMEAYERVEALQEGR